MNILFLALNYILFFATTHTPHAQPSNPAPNPYTSPQACRLNSPGYVCDVHSALDSSQRGTINKKLVQFNDANPCGQCVAVTIFKQIRSGIESKVAHAESKALVTKLANGGWKFPDCKSLIVIIVNTEQRYIYAEPGDKAKFCSGVGGLFDGQKQAFIQRKFGEGIEGMIDDYISGFNRIYTSAGKCDQDTCGGGGQQSAVVPRISAAQLATLLPSPGKNARKCHISSPGFLCDPENVLTDNQRNELNQGLVELSKASSCKQCFAIALIGKSHSTPQDLQAFAKSVSEERGQWQFNQCKGVLLILVSVQDKYVWMKGNQETVHCSEINAIYTRNLQSFKQGNVYEGLAGIIGDYIDGMEKQGQKCTDKCQDLVGKGAGGKGAGGIGGGMGGKVLGFAKTFAMKNKGMIIGIVVGALVLVGCLLCCGMLMCREKTMSALRAAGTAAASQGPRLMGMMGGKGRGGGGGVQYSAGTKAAGEAGGTWGETDGDGKKDHGGGGTWEEPTAPQEPPKYDESGAKKVERGGGGGF